MKKNLTAEWLREHLTYEPGSGLFFVRKSRKWLAKPVGSQLGSVGTHGYIVIRINGQLYRAHRLAWFYIHGRWPKDIDHINGDRIDNRLANLREVTVVQNLANAKRSRANKSGFKGVCRDNSGRKWRVAISVGGKRKSLGIYETPEAAHRAYCDAAAILNREFANFG